MDQPNILIFMTDQQQAAVTEDDNPCQLPNLEKLIEEGIQFKNMFTTMAHCCPSRASFFTGLYPSQHGIYNNVSTNTAINKGLREGVVTFSESLKEEGYDLYFSGKWHISAEENPKDRGWNEWKVNAGKEAAMGATIDSWKKTADKSDTKNRKSGEIVRPGWGSYQLYGKAEESYEETDDYDTVQRAIKGIRKLKDTDNPWCIYMGLFGPHDPFVIPEKYAEMYDSKKIELPSNYEDDFSDKPGVYKRMREVWKQLSDSEVKESIAHYWGYCSMIDDLLGETLSALEETGQSEDTMVIFISDHGESLGAHGLFLKGITPYDETYRIPCVIRWPKGIKKPGTKVESLTSIMDIAPTLLELVNSDEIKNSRGQSLVPWFGSTFEKGWRNTVFNQCNGVETYYTQRMVRTKEYKFVYHPTDTDELYDLNKDPGEMNNLANEKSLAEVKKQMYIKMWQEAAKVDDIIFNDYPTIATADYGPALALNNEKGNK